MARSTMVELIARTRGLIGDPAAAGQTFTDDDVQAALDRRRIDIRYQPLQPRETYSSVGGVLYLDYYSQWTDWESDAVLTQYLYTAVTPTANEWLVGHWQFAVSTLPAIYITGKTYDVYAAAADMLDRWVAVNAGAYDFTSDGQSFHRSQMNMGRMNLANQYRALQRPQQITVTRSDLGADDSPTATGWVNYGDGGPR